MSRQCGLSGTQAHSLTTPMKQHRPALVRGDGKRSYSTRNFGTNVGRPGFPRTSELSRLGLRAVVEGWGGGYSTKPRTKMRREKVGNAGRLQELSCVPLIEASGQRSQEEKLKESSRRRGESDAGATQKAAETCRSSTSNKVRETPETLSVRPSPWYAFCLEYWEAKQGEKAAFENAEHSLA